MDTPGTMGMLRWPCQLSGEQMPSLQSGWEDVNALVSGPMCWTGGQRGKHPLTKFWDHLWALKPALAERRGEKRTLSMLPLGIYHQVQAAAEAWPLKNRQNPLVRLQSLTLSPLGGMFTSGKVPVHAGEMLRFSKGRPVRFGAGSSPQAW